MTSSRRISRVAVPLLLSCCLPLLLAKEKPPVVTTGISLVLGEGGPRVERLVCGDEAFGSGHFTFFHPDGRTLCTRDERAYPGATVIRIARSAAPVTLPSPWRLADGPDSLLLFDGSAPFSEGSDETGTPLTATSQGYYVDEQGLLRTPRFIYRGDTWEPVVPLRELFLLEIGLDRRFTVTVVTAADLSAADRDPARFLGIGCERAAVKQRTANLIVVEGERLSSAAIPRLRLTEEGDLFGRYRIEVRGSAPATKKRKERACAAGAVTARAESGAEGSFLFEAVIGATDLSPEEATAFADFLEKNVPHRYEVKP